MTNCTIRNCGVSGTGRFLRTALTLTLILLIAIGGAVPVRADTTYPKATDYIADDAAVLSESTVREIKEKNTVLSNQAEAVIAVCTVKTTDGVDIGKYARSVYTEWKMPSGVLILIAVDDNAFFLVQSASISDVVTNEALEDIRDRDIEADFAAGNIDRAVRKAVSQLSILMLSGLKSDGEKADGDSASESSSGTESRTGTRTENDTGSIVVRVLKGILFAVLILVAVFVLLFIIALFNDNVAEFMRVHIFRRGGPSDRGSSDYYDDRLYDGDGQDRRRQQRANQNRQYNGSAPRANRPNQNQRNQYQPVQYQQYPNQPVQYQQYPNQQAQYQQYPNQQAQYQQYPNQQAQYQQYPNQQVQYQQYPNQQVQYQQYPNRQAQYRQQNQAGAPRRTQNRAPQTPQPYSAENDPKLIRQRQQAQQEDPSSTQTYTIPGRQNKA